MRRHFFLWACLAVPTPVWALWCPKLVRSLTEKYGQSEVKKVVGQGTQRRGLQNVAELPGLLEKSAQWTDSQKELARTQIVDRLRHETFNETSTESLPERRLLQSVLATVDNPVQRFQKEMKAGQSSREVFDALLKERGSNTNAAEVLAMAKKLQSGLHEITPDMLDGQALEISLYGSLANGLSKAGSDVDLMVNGTTFDARFAPAGTDAPLYRILHNKLRDEKFELERTLMPGSEAAQARMALTSPVMVVVRRDGIFLKLFPPKFSYDGSSVTNSAMPTLIPIE